MQDSQLFVIWLIGGATLMLLEFVVPGGIVFFLGLGATLVSLLLFIGLIDGWMLALTTWFIVSLALIFGLRGVVQRLVPAQVERGGTNEDLDAYNQVAVVSETIPANGRGRISFRGSTWAARNYHADRGLETGTRVRIIFRDNLEWVVEAFEPLATDPDKPTTEIPKE